MRTTNRLHARFGQPEVFDLAFADPILHAHLVDRDVRVDPVLIEEIDPFDLESSWACDGAAYRFGVRQPRGPCLRAA